MFAVEESPQAENIIEKAFITWVNLYKETDFSQIQSIYQLADCSFFFYIMEGVKNFKLQHPIIDSEQELNLTAKVARAKNITRSLQKFHRNILLRDITDIEINYVEFSMGNKTEILKMITLVLSALAGSEMCGTLFEKIRELEQIDQESAQMMNIFIDNSMKIGVSSGSSSKRSWDHSAQKKTLLKMEELELKVDELEQLNQKLQEKINFTNELNDNLQKQNKSLKQKIQTLLKRNEELEEINEMANNQLQMSSIEETATKKKMEVIRKNLQERNDDLYEELERVKKQLKGKEYLKIKIEEISEINKEIRQENSCLRRENAQFERIKAEFKKKQKQYREEILKLKEQCGELQIKIQELSTIKKSKKDSHGHDEEQNRSQYLGYQHEHGNSSNIYRIKDSLSFLNNQSLQMNKVDHNFLNSFTIANPHNNNQTIHEQSNEDQNSILASIKENESIYFNLNQEQNQSKHFGKGSEQCQKGQFPLSKINCSQTNEYYEWQIKMLIEVVLQLQENLQLERKKNYGSIEENQSIRMSRLMKFKQKSLQCLRKDENNEFR